MASKYTQDEIERLRDQRYHRTPSLRARTPQQALEFVNEVGYCFLFGDKGVEIPTLWAAVCGCRREIPHEHHDADLGRTWEWKDTLPTAGSLHYGKLLRGKPTLVSLDLLPTFYALSPNYGDEDDYLVQYREGHLSADAKSVYEALLVEGAMATSRLRQLAGLAGGGATARRFDKAVADLQTELKIAKVGISDANRWGYAYVYDLFVRRFPHVPELAHAIRSDEAMDTLLRHYLHNVVAVPEKEAQRLFRWEPWEWERTVARLQEAGLIRRNVVIEGISENCLAETVLPQ
ncbi:MAG: AlkZ-related protein [Anaerolineae bacterium]